MLLPACPVCRQVDGWQVAVCVFVSAVIILYINIHPMSSIIFERITIFVDAPQPYAWILGFPSDICINFGLYLTLHPISDRIDITTIQGVIRCSHANARCAVWNFRRHRTVRNTVFTAVTRCKSSVTGHIKRRKNRERPWRSAANRFVRSAVRLLLWPLAHKSIAETALRRGKKPPPTPSISKGITTISV